MEAQNINFTSQTDQCVFIVIFLPVISPYWLDSSG